MHNSLLCTFPLLVALAACSSSDSSSEAAASSDPQQASKAKLRVPVGSPVLIDSSDYVMYPLSLNEIVTEAKDEYGGSYSGRTTTYWNILFYNLRSNESHLLSPNKLVISSYAGQDTEHSSDSEDSHKAYSRTYAADKLLYFSATSTDFNHDGQLTNADPTYLFISEKSGNNFRQISPDSLHVTGWEIQRNAGKVLLQATQDSNHNRKFDEGDESIPYVYDIATEQPASRAFTPALMDKLRTQFQQQWPKQPK
jgi:hypothetical protein